MENEALRMLYNGQMALGDALSPVEVHINQFYGIEINDFAVTVALTALWIAESQMIKETEDIVGQQLEFLPLKSYANIHEGNALRMNWESIIPQDKLNYIMGNPPFGGARLINATQKEDIELVFGKDWKNAGNLDYVSCWFKKCSDFMQGTTISAALVATNSVAQGDSVATLWKPLLGTKIFFDFAYRTFRWDSDSNGMAHVHCVIVGFKAVPLKLSNLIYSGNEVKRVSNINGYLIDGQNTFIESRTLPIYDVPHLGIGNKPIDGGFYLFTKEEKDSFIEKEPKSEKFFRPFYGATEFIDQKPRYCLFLKKCTPEELQAMPLCCKRVEEVKKYRLKSPSEGTRKLASYPRKFHVENLPDSTYLLIPSTSSENRDYIPMGYMKPENIASNATLILPNATLYHFGVLTSSVHMAWMRTVGGRLEMRYRYSKDIIYNNFPWPKPTEKQRTKIEETAQKILDVRSRYPNSSYASLYNPPSMPEELQKAHKANDRAVMAAYGFKPSLSEEDIVAELFKQYEQRLTELAKEEAEAKAKKEAEKIAEKERRKKERAEERERKKEQTQAKRKRPSKASGS